MKYLKKVQMIPILLGSLVLANCTASNSHHLHDQMVKHEMDISMAIQSEIPSRYISTHVDYGVLQAAGFVENQKELAQVANILEDYGRDYRVINNVKVLAAVDDPKDERHLKRAIKAQLEESKFPIKDIGVQVKNGHVILSGFINKHVDLQRMTREVKHLPGVKHVDNYVLYRQSNQA